MEAPIEAWPLPKDSSHSRAFEEVRFPRTRVRADSTYRADHQSLSSIKVRHTALSSYIVLIVVNHLPSDRGSELTTESSTETIPGVVNGFGKGVGDQELKTMTQVFLQRGL
jgi:hypothetical protein